MITSKRRFTAFICLIALLPLMTGCTTTQTSQAFTGFTIEVDAASITAVGLCATGTIPAADCVVLLPVLSGAASVAPQIQAELASADLLAVQVAKSVALLVPIGQAIPGLSPQAQLVLAGIRTVAQVFSAALEQLLPIVRAMSQMKTSPSVPAHVLLTWKDRRVLNSGVALSRGTQARISAYQAAHPMR